MKKDNFFRKAARWVARMFGYKAENKYARAVWYVFATSASIVTLLLAAGLIENLAFGISDMRQWRERERIENSPTYLHNYRNQYVSPYVIYHDGFPGYLYNTILGRRTATGIKWVCDSSDGDSLSVFCTNKEEPKRGYFNRYTGEVVVPAQFDKAWIFSEGVACVLDKGVLYFIDHKGHSLMDKVFPFTPCINDYCFHRGLCSMKGDNNLIGLVDKQGNWVVDPSYYEMYYDKKGFWIIRDREWNYGLLDAQGKMLLPMEYSHIYINHDESCIRAQRLDHSIQVFDFDGNIINSCDYDGIDKIRYAIDEYDECGSSNPALVKCLKYYVYVYDDYYYGLMDKKGNILTPPSYTEITAIDPDRYFCDSPRGAVILDSKGKECGKKL
jgi:hypothetical protein